MEKSEKINKSNASTKDTPKVIPKARGRTINNLDDVIKYVNKLTTENIDVKAELDKEIISITNTFSSQKLKDEFMGLIKNEDIYRESRRLYPSKVDLIYTTGRQVQLKLLDCTKVVQALHDKAIEKNA